MKSIIIIFQALWFSLSTFSQSSHIVYIRYDFTMSKEVLIDQIQSLKESFGDNQSFSIYYSNARLVMDKQNWDANDLYSTIIEQMAYPAISTHEELYLISELYEKLSAKAASDQNGTCIFHLIVGNEFVNSGYVNSLLARAIVVNSIDTDNSIMKVCFYPCGANYSLSDLKFDSKYDLNIEYQLIRVDK